MFSEQLEYHLQITEIPEAVEANSQQIVDKLRQDSRSRLTTAEAQGLSPANYRDFNLNTWSE